MQPEPSVLEHAQRNQQTTRHYIHLSAPRPQPASTSSSSVRNYETSGKDRTRYETPDPSQDYFESSSMTGTLQSGRPKTHSPPNPEQMNQSTSSFVRTPNQNAYASRSPEIQNTSPYLSSTSHISDVSSTATGDNLEHAPTWGYSADNTESLERCAQAIANTIRLAAFYSNSYDRMIMP